MDDTSTERPAALPRVLVVEDDAAVQPVMAEMLARAGYAVRTVASAPHALTAVAAERPALILLDLGLPGMNGWEVLQQLRAEGAPLPVVLVMAYSHLAAQALEAGAAATLLKPFDLNDLLSLVARLLGGPPAPAAGR